MRIVPYSYHEGPRRVLTSAYTRATDFVEDLPIRDSGESNMYVGRGVGNNRDEEGEGDCRFPR